MYFINNQERRDIIRMLETLRSTLEVSKSLRRANMVRVAGLLIGQLERKKKIPSDMARAIKTYRSDDSQLGDLKRHEDMEGGE